MNTIVNPPAWKLLSKDISTKLRGRSIEVRGKEYLKSLYKYYITDIGIRNQKINYRQIEVTQTKWSRRFLPSILLQTATKKY